MSVAELGAVWALLPPETQVWMYSVDRGGTRFSSPAYIILILLFRCCSETSEDTLVSPCRRK
eukprot:2910809-Amphidinium_carterae.2